MTNFLRFKWWWLGAMTIVAMVLTLHLVPRSARSTSMLNCHTELYDRDDSGTERHHLVNDFVVTGHSARMYFRYFSPQGDPLASIIMTGKALRRSADRIFLEMNRVESKIRAPDQSLPSHFVELSGYSERNLDANGVHYTTIDILRHDNEAQSLVIQLHPSQALFSCVRSL